MATTNNSENIDICTKRITSIHEYVPGKTTIGVEGVVMKVADLVKTYQTALDARTEAVSAQAQLTGARAKRKTADAARVTTDKALRAWVVGRYGEGSPQAIAFGFPPRKKPGRSVANKSHAVALAKATRVARGTMGKKEKEKIRGVVPGDAPPPATSGAMVAVTTAPATVSAQPVVSAPAPAVTTATNGAASAH